MNHTPEDQKTEPATHAPFRLSCTCGADINAPDRPFTLGPIALVSHANHALIWLRCQTCKADHELALWTIDQQRFISEVGPEAFQPEDPQAVKLLGQYERPIQQYRCDMDGQYEQHEDWPVLYLSLFDVEIQTDWLCASAASYPRRPFPEKLDFVQHLKGNPAARQTERGARC